MSTRFAKIAFTESVKAAQRRYGSRHANRGLESSAAPRDVLTDREMRFIQERDGFYQATVGENGWPYVQFRGGPPGFLKVLDERTIAYADFRGNLQYLSVGNLSADDRVALILMDYAYRRRLKIWARAQVSDKADAAELIARLEMPGYQSPIERGIIFTVEAYDWNCPKHITPRFTLQEIQTTLLAPLEARIANLERENRALKATMHPVLQGLPTEE